jgi:excisionase family DNA binding protein
MAKVRKATLPPGYVMADTAAQILGISQSRMYQYISEERIPSFQIGRSYMMRVEDVEQFKANPSGRTRTKPPSWHVYKSGGKLFVSEIHVQVRAGQQAQLTEKLQAIQNADEHTFPGTIARYIVKNDAELNSVKILLIWKSTEMPDEQARQQHLAAFQAELADVLDWEAAQVEMNEAIIHT